MMNFLRVIVLFIFALSGFSSSAQSTLRFENFSTQDGLGNNVIFDAKTDNKGQLWLATFDGLSCYNGYQFKTFKPDVSNPRVSGSNILRVIEPDSLGNIWFATAGSSFSILNPETNEFKYFNTPDLNTKKIVRSDIHSICHFKKSVWLASTEAIYIFDRETQDISAFTAKEYGLNGEISDLLNIDPSKTLISTQQGILILNHNNPDGTYTVIHRNELDFNDNIHRVSVSDKDIFLVSDNLIKCYTNENEEFNPKFEIHAEQLALQNIRSINFQSITHLSANEYWIVTSRGLLIYNADKPNNYNFIQSDENDPESLAGNLITSICKDREGNVWLTNRFNGLSKFNPTNQAFSKFSKETRLGRQMTNNDVRALLTDKTGNIWIGYRDAGIDLVDSKSNNITRFNNSNSDSFKLPSNSIRAIYEDINGTIWVGTGRGAIKLTFKKGQYQLESIYEIDGQSLGIVYMFLEDTSNRFWIGSNQGLFLYDKLQNTLRAFRQTVSGNDNRFINSVRCLVEDKQGNIWIATDGSGISVFHPGKGFIKSFSTGSKVDSPLSHNKIYSLLIDSKERVWVGTHNGLNLMLNESGEFKTFSREDGLSNDIVYGLIEDEEGMLWISTANGLSKFNPETETFQNYMQGFEFSDDAWSKSKNGAILVGGTNGFFQFHPQKVHQNKVPPTIRVNEFQLQNKKLGINEIHNGRVILNKTISEQKRIELNHNENFFSFELLAVSLGHPHQVKYQYQLNGFNDNWIDMDANSRTAYFTNVPYGNYQFKYKAANADGIWSDEKQIEVIIHPAYYQTFLFQLLMTIVLLMLIFLLYWLRLQRLTRQKKKLKREVIEKTKELRQQNRAIEKQNKQLEIQKNEIEEQRDKVVEMTRLIHETDERKIKFFTNISHEIRTPLTLITGPIDKLLSSLNKDDRHYSTIQLVERNSNRLLNLVNQLLDFRKMDSGHMPIHLEKNDLLQFLKQQLDTFQPLAQKKALSLSFQAEQADYQVYFDNDVLEKIISNLMSNAIKYTQLQGEIMMKLRRLAEGIEIDIQDNGPGILPSIRQAVFKRFYRVEEAYSKPQQGTGIGLALSREMAILHGGDLSYVDQTERGSCFRLNFPIFESPEDETIHTSQKQDTTLPQAEISVTNENFKVLIVEDNADLRSFIVDSLPNNEVIEANNGKEGIVLALEHLPDLIISDVLMPKKNGFELCKTLKDDARTNHIPILLLTALGAEENQLTGINLGADDYIVKPFNHRILRGKVNNILRNRRSLKEKLQDSLVKTEVKEVNWKESLPPFVLQIVTHIEEHLQDKQFGVDELSQLMAMSHSTLYRKMKAITDKTTVEFIREVKMRNALDLLQKDKQIQIAEVAYLVGFEDVNYFRQCFKKQFGKTPTELAR